MSPDLVVDEPAQRPVREQALPRDPVADEVRPRADERVDPRVDSPPDAVQGPDGAADARAGHEIRLQPALLERAQDAPVREPADAAGAEREADAEAAQSPRHAADGATGIGRVR